MDVLRLNCNETDDTFHYLFCSFQISLIYSRISNFFHSWYLWSILLQDTYWHQSWAIQFVTTWVYRFYPWSKLIQSVQLVFFYGFHIFLVSDYGCACWNHSLIQNFTNEKRRKKLDMFLYYLLWSHCCSSFLIIDLIEILGLYLKYVSLVLEMKNRRIYIIYQFSNITNYFIGLKFYQGNMFREQNFICR